jgi:hypothetical protein
MTNLNIEFFLLVHKLDRLWHCQVLYVDIHVLQMRVRVVFIDGKWNFNLLYMRIPTDVRDRVNLLPVWLTSKGRLLYLEREP